MKNALIRLVFGLPIIACIVGVSGSANAQGARWVNAKHAADGTAFYLSVSGGGWCDPGHGSCHFNDGQQLILWSSQTLDQLWYSPSENMTGDIRSVGFLNDSADSFMCVSIAGGSGAQGTNAVVWPCASPLTADQRWTPVAASTYNLTAPGCFVLKTQTGSGSTTNVLAVAAGNMANGTHVVQWPITMSTATLDMAWCPE
jgi:hypothetical protein